MNVTIRQREEEYISDYPSGWKFSAGDPFKFPVMIGDNPCFVKRFEQKSPGNISGWDLLVKMRGVDQINLSTVLDIRNEEEDGKQIYYVFYQYLDGITLDKYIRQPGIDINLLHLKNDLFNAISTLQNYGFWFADFTEKNIFHQTDGSFVLMDVDSAQRISDLPVNQMYGSKDYWILVLKFYKEILNKSNIRLSDINGINLNYLQIPFLVLRLKIFLAGSKEDYNSTAVFNQLPTQLDKMAPDFRDIYLKVTDSGKDSLPPEDIRKIEDLVEKKIIKAGYTPVLTAGSARLPVIREFKQSSNEIESGGSFTLRWVVENVNKLELYKNGALFKGLDLSQKDITLKEFADGTRQESSYQLFAYNDLDMAKSSPSTIRLKSEPGQGSSTLVTPKKNRRGLIVAAIAFVVIASGLVFFLTRPEDLPQMVIRQEDLYEDSTLTLYGETINLSDIKILFENKELAILSHSDTSLTLTIPKLAYTIPGHVAHLLVTENDQTIFSENLIVKYDSVDLIGLASESYWIEGEIMSDGTIRDGESLPWPGDSTDVRGFVRIDSISMENGIAYKVLRTHPRWIANGTIRGFSPWMEMKGKKTFKSMVGFVENGQSLDGVVFQSWVHYQEDNIEKTANLLRESKIYNGKINEVSADLPDNVNRFCLELRVDAGNFSNSDWAAWIKPVIVSRRLLHSPAK